MNKILSLFDESFVIDLFTKEVLPHYPAFKSVSRVKIKAHKNLIWETTYHVVIGFSTYFLKANGEEVKIPIFCSAHSEETRDNVYQALKYLWRAHLPTKFIDIPDPLFYSEYFQGTFYRGLRGHNLLHYIKQQDFRAVKQLVPLAAKLFARLHRLPTAEAVNFNPLNSRIATVVPGVNRIQEEVLARYHGKYQPVLRQFYDYFIAREEKYFVDGGASALIHGDAHPENILATGIKRLGLIDFTDMCLGDPARDVGSFLQQLDYKIIGKTGEAGQAKAVKKLFLDTYLSAAKQELTPEFQARIDLYYNWTTLRTAIFWLLKFEHDEARANVLLEQIKNNLPM
ncbi:MAG: phosphotransferase [Patescibacteria group bacterium]